MLRVGVVPFYHPEYDTQFSTLPEDHYLRVKTPKEMFEKIEELESNPTMRIKLVKQLQVQFLQGVRRGEFLCDVMNPFLERAGIEVQMVKGFSEEVIRTVELNEDIKTKKEEVKAKSLF
jgi:hypothetical protein